MAVPQHDLLRQALREHLEMAEASFRNHEDPSLEEHALPRQYGALTGAVAQLGLVKPHLMLAFEGRLRAVRKLRDFATSQRRRDNECIMRIARAHRRRVLSHCLLIWRLSRRVAGITRFRRRWIVSLAWRAFARGVEALRSQQVSRRMLFAEFSAVVGVNR
jgi:hypothetical protein